MTDWTHLTLDELWNDVPDPTEAFAPERLEGLPGSARRYLQHAIAPGTPLASAVRLKIEGHIKLGERWFPFEAEQVIRWDRGLIWKARTRMGPLFVSGSDRFIDGEGAMRWKLLGIVPIMTADGPDVSRSAAGRLEAEAIWLPSVLLRHDDVAWTEEADGSPLARIRVEGDEREIRYTIDDAGRLEALRMPRWGNPDGGPFHEAPFGGLMEQERSWGGYTIPSQVRIGWHFGTDRSERGGEFFRATITEADYR